MASPSPGGDAGVTIRCNVTDYFHDTKNSLGERKVAFGDVGSRGGVRAPNEDMLYLRWNQNFRISKNKLGCLRNPSLVRGIYVPMYDISKLSFSSDRHFFIFYFLLFRDGRRIDSG